MTEEREYYVRPTSVRIKGATPCLHFVRGAPGTKQSGAPHSAPDCLVPEVAPLTRFAFNYVETQLHSLQNPSKLGSYSLVSVFATHAGRNF